MIGRIRRFGAAVRGAWQRRAAERGVDVLFYAAWWMDETWTRSAAFAALRNGMSVALAVPPAPQERERWIVKEYRACGATVFSPIDTTTLRALRAKVVVTATNGLKRQLFYRGARSLVHMPHSLVSLHMIYAADSFDGYDTLFACGRHHAREFERLSAMRRLPGRRALVVGYGKLDLLGRDLPAMEPRHVLIGPSWGEKNILNTVGADLVESLLAAGCRVTVRPHPIFVQRSDPAWTTLCERFAGRDGFAAESPFDGDGAILKAEVLITDYSGIAFEYAALRRRRCVFVDVAKKVINPAWEDTGLEPVEVGLRRTLGVVVAPETKAVVHAVLECAQDRGCSDSVEKALPEFLANQGTCGEVAARALVEIAAASG